MSCRWIADHPDELAGELPPDHLAACTDCARALDRTQAVLRRALVDVEPAAIPPALQQRIARSLGERPRRRLAIGLGLGFAVAVAVAIIAVRRPASSPAAPPFERAEHVVALGVLELDITPAARLELDGDDRGTVARATLNLRAGTHHLKLRAAGVTTEITVEIRPGETTLLRRDLRAR